LGALRVRGKDLFIDNQVEFLWKSFKKGLRYEKAIISTYKEDSGVVYSNSGGYCFHTVIAMLRRVSNRRKGNRAELKARRSLLQNKFSATNS
jgi:hypothetical protein